MIVLRDTDELFIIILQDYSSKIFLQTHSCASSWKVRSSCLGLLILLMCTQGSLSWYQICWCLETKSGGNLKYKWATFVTEALPEDLSIALQPSAVN